MNRATTRTYCNEEKKDRTHMLADTRGLVSQHEKYKIDDEKPDNYSFEYRIFHDWDEH